MTGDQHYRAAEQYLRDAGTWPENAALYLSAAQVHATLALAACTAEVSGTFTLGKYGMPR